MLLCLSHCDYVSRCYCDYFTLWFIKFRPWDFRMGKNFWISNSQKKFAKKWRSTSFQCCHSHVIIMINQFCLITFPWALICDMKNSWSNLKTTIWLFEVINKNLSIAIVNIVFHSRQDVSHIIIVINLCHPNTYDIPLEQWNF